MVDITGRTKLIHKFPKEETFVSMIIFKDILFVATSRKVYKLWPDDVLREIDILL